MKQFILAVLITASTLAPLASAQHISVGVIGGVPFTGGFSDTTTSDAVSAVPLLDATQTHTYSDSKEYAVGAMVDVRLPLSLGLEIDALYRPLNLTSDSVVLLSTGSTLNAAGPTTHSSQNLSTWEFPVLGKFRLPLLPIVKPFVEAGPSFRAKGSSLSYLSGKGFTFGAGIEAKILKLRIAPVIRYTHWGSDSPGSAIACAGACVTIPVTAPPSNQNQAEFLVGFSF